MNSYDKSKIGRLISLGAEHTVFIYGQDKIIKFLNFYFLFGEKAYKKSLRDYEICRKFFGEYILATEFAISPNQKYIAQIQPKIEKGHYLGLMDLKKETVRQKFNELINDYNLMIKAGYPEIDLVGSAGAFGRYLGNILVTDDQKIIIIDATTLEAKGVRFLEPIMKLLRKWGLSRQNAFIKMAKEILI